MSRPGYSWFSRQTSSVIKVLSHPFTLNPNSIVKEDTHGRTVTYLLHSTRIRTNRLARSAVAGSITSYLQIVPHPRRLTFLFATAKPYIHE